MIFNRIPMCAFLGLFLVLFGLLLAGISTVSFLEQIASNKRNNYPNILNLRDYIYIGMYNLFGFELNVSV